MRVARGMRSSASERVTQGDALAADELARRFDGRVCESSSARAVELHVRGCLLRCLCYAASIHAPSVAGDARLIVGFDGANHIFSRARVHPPAARVLQRGENGALRNRAELRLTQSRVDALRTAPSPRSSFVRWLPLSSLDSVIPARVARMTRCKLLLTVLGVSVLMALAAAAPAAAPAAGAGRVPTAPIESTRSAAPAAHKSKTVLSLDIPTTIPAHVHSELSRPGKFVHLSHPDVAIARAAQVSLNCTICEGLVAALIPMLNTSAVENDIENAAIYACEAMAPLCHGVSQCDQVCEGIVGEHASEFFTLLFELVVNPLEVCAIIHQCPVPPTPLPSTVIPVPSDLKNLRGEIEWPSWSLQEGQGTFIHLSDAHIDPTYAPGMSTSCGLPVCCHETDGPGPTAGTTAGYFGAYQCDTSPQLAQSLLDFLVTLDPLPDFVLYTGDDPAHDVS